MAAKLSLSGLERIEEGQKGIERFFVGTEMTAVPSGANVDSASKKRARSLSVEPPRKVTKLKPPVVQPPPLAEPRNRPHLPTFTCPRCSRVLAIPSAALDDLPADPDSAAVHALLAKERGEHDDYHFARDILEGERKAQRNDVGAGKRSAPSASGSRVVAKGATSKSSGQQSLKGFFGKR